MMIPSSACLDQSLIQHLLDHDPVVTDYRTFFSSKQRRNKFLCIF